MIFNFTGSMYVSDATLEKMVQQARLGRAVDDVVDDWIDTLDEDDCRAEYVRTQVIDYVWDLATERECY